MGHEAVRRGAVPVILTGLKEHSVTRADHLYRTAFALAEADALGDEDGLPMWMGVPGGAGTRCEADVGGRERR